MQIKGMIPITQEGLIRSWQARAELGVAALDAIDAGGDTKAILSQWKADDAFWRYPNYKAYCDAGSEA